VIAFAIVAVAAITLYFAFGMPGMDHGTPAVGAILMSVSTIVVALNAQTLRRVRLNPQSSA
jgi:cation transport ATPase